MTLTLVTIDTMSACDRDKIINACGLSHAKQADVNTVLDFFCHLPKSGVHVCPLELVKARASEFDDLIVSLINVLTRKLELDYVHVAIGCGGDVHEAFETDIALGLRVDEDLEDVYSRARVLNNENIFRSVVKSIPFRQAPRTIWVRDVYDFELKSRHSGFLEWISGP